MCLLSKVYKELNIFPVLRCGSILNDWLHLYVPVGDNGIEVKRLYIIFYHV